MPTKPIWGKQNNGNLDVKTETKVLDKTGLKEKLESMRMDDVRSFAKQHKLKAKDTDKDELIKEILEEL